MLCSGPSLARPKADGRDGEGPGKGCEVLINGQFRVFLDTFKVAYGVAMNAISKRPADLVQIRGWETVLEDGRLG